MSLIELTDETFESTIKSSGSTPVVVDFWASWCGPCKQLLPVMEEVANELGDKVKIHKLNIDDYADLAAKYEVRSIPTLLLFKDGQVKNVKVGSDSKQKIIDWIKSNS